MASAIGTEDDAVAFMVAAGLMFEAIAAFCSSPQTAEINADKRAATLMKWVHIGMINGAALILIAAFIDKKRWPALMGGAFAGTSMYLSYVYAKRSGLKSNAPGTEN